MSSSCEYGKANARTAVIGGAPAIVVSHPDLQSPAEIRSAADARRIAEWIWTHAAELEGAGVPVRHAIDCPGGPFCTCERGV